MAAAYPDIELVFAGRPDIDLAIEGSAAAEIEKVGPEAVINAAAYTAVDQAEDEPEHAFRINADAPSEIAAAATRVGAPVIHVSTDYVFDGLTDGCYTEAAEPSPLSVYGRTKLAGEDQVRSENPRAAIVRTAWVYSPFGRNFLTTMVAAAETRDVLSVVDDQRGSPTSALDLASGLIAILRRWARGDDRGQGETYHLAGSGATSWCCFAQAIMDECRKRGLPAADVKPIRTEHWATKAARPRNSALDSAKFSREFGFVMPPWRDSLAKVMDRLVEQR